MDRVLPTTSAVPLVGSTSIAATPHQCPSVCHAIATSANRTKLGVWAACSPAFFLETSEDFMLPGGFVV